MVKPSDDRSFATGYAVPKLAIRGFAAVFQKGQNVTDPATLASLVPISFDDEVFSDYLADGSLDPDLVDAIAPGGVLDFDYDGESAVLRVSVEYTTRRALSAPELRALVEYTLGQWSGGIGETWASVSMERTGYSIQCVFHGEGLPAEYPWVDVREADQF
jgi:hypothetical protein